MRKLPKLAMPLGVAVFIGLFVLGQWRQVWLPFWIVGTIGSGTFAVWLAAPRCGGRGGYGRSGSCVASSKPRRWWRSPVTHFGSAWAI